MSLRFMPDGAIVVDTVDEALIFERKRAKPSQKARGGRPKAQKGSEVALEGTWERFCTNLHGPAGSRMRKLLALIKGRGEAGMTIHELSEAVGDPTVNVTAGTTACLTKNVRKAGLDPEQVVIRGQDGKFRPGVLLQTQDPPSP